jgi:hypothetical protein
MVILVSINGNPTVGQSAGQGVEQAGPWYITPTSDHHRPDPLIHLEAMPILVFVLGDDDLLLLEPRALQLRQRLGRGLPPLGVNYMIRRTSSKYHIIN